MPSASKRKYSSIAPVVQNHQFTKLELVTPKQAKEWLESSNTKNRNIREQHVNMLAREMELGRWKENGDAICFDWNGRLLDGQHRLSACMKSDKPFYTNVTRNIDPAADITKDKGIPKTASDHLVLEGEKHGTLLASILRGIWAWENGKLSGYRSIKTSTADLIDTLRQHPNARESATAVQNNDVMPGSLAGFCHYAFGTKDPDARDVFFHRLFTGLDVAPTDSVYHLRQYMLHAKSSRTQAKLTVTSTLALTINAWNAMRQGKFVKQLKYRAATEFPTIQ